ncbi:MAG: FAD-binding oxidoreductase [Halioglobus sp.]|nr:FAD-binding oxidoreductase [Halioglobus sp.]
MHSPAAPHPPSYYAATRSETVAFSPLCDTVRSDVCVVGGGFTGIATALSLAERGYSVTVLEQHRVGWGASGRNGGQMLGGVPGEARLERLDSGAYADSVFELGYRGHDIIARRVQQYGIDCDLKYGALDVALRPRHLERQQRMYESLCQRGMEPQLRLVSAADLSVLLGTDQYLGGLVNMRNGHLHPLNLCLGQARAAAGLGAAIYEGSEVTAIDHGTPAVVRTAHGSVTADFVVLAGNGYQHLEPALFSGLVFPAGSYIIATEPLSPDEAASINAEDLAVCDMNEVLDYFRLSADRRLLFGGRCHYSGREPRSIEKAMLPRLRQVYPQLAHRRIDYAWGGKIGIVVNRVPLLGRIGANVFYALGYSGHGVSLSHAFGEVLADAVTGSSKEMDLFARVPHRKLPFGQRAGAQLVALGMLYFRLRDWL